MDAYKPLKNFLQDLVAGYALEKDGGYCLDIDEMPEDERSKLLYLYMEYKKRDGAAELFTQNESEIKDICIDKLLRFLKNDNLDTRKELVEIIKFNALQKYKEWLQELINVECDIYYSSKMESLGLNRRIYPDNGETYWSIV